MWWEYQSGSFNQANKMIRRHSQRIQKDAKLTGFRGRPLKGDPKKTLGILFVI
jgi:hypothetical protein